MNSLVEILLSRHIQAPLGHAFSFVENENRVTQLSNAQLLSAASTVAQSLCEHTRTGDRVVLLALEGVDFIAGSQKNIWESYESSPRFLASEDYRVMTLPKGSSVLMDSRVVHSGTANTSHDCMRPVFYFSFGEKDISGPTYSIRSEYSGKYKLNDFCN